MRINFGLLGAALAGTALLIASTVSAFPLYLTSASGTISYTPDYAAIVGTNADVARISTVSVRMTTLLTVISNQLYLNSSSNTFPANAKLVYDPYWNATYLTNSSGVSQSVSGIARVSLNAIATSFRVTGTNSLIESDKVNLTLQVSGKAPNGNYFEFQVGGVGTLQYSLDRNNQGSMSLSLSNGGGSGDNAGNNGDGVAIGGFVLRGTGTPEWRGPFSTSWY